MRRKFQIAIFLITVAALVGCGSSGPKEPGSIIENELDGAPDWVLEGKGDDEVIYGVGAVAGTRNVTLARSTAEGRGRTEIARSLEVSVESMLKDYQSTTTGGEYFAEGQRRTAHRGRLPPDHRHHPDRDAPGGDLDRQDWHALRADGPGHGPFKETSRAWTSSTKRSARR